MFGGRITLFRLFGFEVRLDASWIVIAALITWSLATGVFPAQYHGLSRAAYWWMGVAGALGLFASIVLHELSHSLVANHYRLPMKGITLFIFGGVAEMGGEPRSPKVEFLMAIVGPIISILAGIAFYLVRIVAAPHWPIEVVGVLAYLAWINWVLAAFNLVPAFPLDGGRVLRSALWHFRGDLAGATAIASRIGSAFGVLLMAFALYQLFSGYVISAIWYFMIGIFLRGASRLSYEQTMLHSILRGRTIEHFMRPNPVTVPAHISVRQLVEDYIYRYHFKMFPVLAEDGRLTGCVTTEDVKDVPREEWDRRRVSEIARPSSPRNTVPPDTEALKALSRMQKTGVSRLLVTDHGRLLAIVSLKDLLAYLATKLELEGNASPRPAHQH